jgi:hypothetical protein
MSRIAAFLMTLVVSVTLFVSASSAQERSQGISVHMLPKRVADIGGMAWGFTVDPSPRLKAASPRPILQTAEDILSFIRKQDTAVQENGLWIVMTNPDAYSETEKTLLENVKSMCRQERIPLFICRASELPNGWARFDQ